MESEIRASLGRHVGGRRRLGRGGVRAPLEHRQALPDAIVDEIGRSARRVEVQLQELGPTEVAPAALVESDLYRGGEQLMPWQRAFVGLFLHHREVYGRARMLLEDEVGVGKTLSLAGSALVSALLGDGPILILCPATLTTEWQMELKDKLNPFGGLAFEREGLAARPRRVAVALGRHRRHSQVPQADCDRLDRNDLPDDRGASSPPLKETWPCGRPTTALPGPVLHRLDCTSFRWRLRKVGLAPLLSPWCGERHGPPAAGAAPLLRHRTTGMDRTS
jgi:hypothetical protein